MILAGNKNGRNPMNTGFLPFCLVVSHFYPEARLIF
jgi:hypothetical protein